MLKQVIFTIILAIPAIILPAQNKEYSSDFRPLNIITVNLCGDASLISLYYERLFLINPTIFLTGKLGIGLNEATLQYIFGYKHSLEVYFITIPHHITCNFGKGIHFFETGMGGSMIYRNTDQNYFLYPIIGYRIQPLKSDRVNFRIFGIIPFSGYDHEEICFSPLGLSLGICL